MRNILLTGGSGLLGQELQKYIKCDAPESFTLDITNIGKVGKYHTIIHCAAYTDVARAEKETDKCFEVNVVGTLNLLKAFPDAKFVYISSEYAKNPVNFYSWTKLWGEEMVKKFSDNYLIIRTLFKPNPWPYNKAFGDQWTTGDYINVIAPMIAKEILKETQGTINIGTGRKTMLELAQRTKPNVEENSIDDMEVPLPKDYANSNSR